MRFVLRESAVGQLAARGTICLLLAWIGTEAVTAGLSRHRGGAGMLRPQVASPVAVSDLPFRFADALVDNLALVNEMQERLANQDQSGDAVEEALRAMINIRVGMSSMRRALLLIEPFLNTDDEILNKSAALIVSLYTQVLEADRGLLQVMVSASTSIEFLGAASKWLAQKDVVLRLIPEAVGASAAVLVDYESAEQTGTPTRGSRLRRRPASFASLRHCSETPSRRVQ